MQGVYSVIAVVGIGLAGLLVYDMMFSKRCQHIVPVFDVMDPTCLLAGNKRAGLLMNPAGIGNWLRNIQGSADKLYNRNAAELYRDSLRRGSQPVRTYTSPPGQTSGGGSPGTSQAVGPGRATTPPGSSGAPKIVPELKSRFNPEMQKQIKAGIYRQPTYVKKLIEQSKYRAPGRPALKPSPLSFEEFTRWLKTTFQDPIRQHKPPTFQQWLEYIKGGGAVGQGYRSGGILEAIAQGLKSAKR